MSKQDKINRTAERKYESKCEAFYEKYQALCEEFDLFIDQDLYYAEVVRNKDHNSWYPNVCVVCNKRAPLVDGECPDCRH
jgi:hypothetical protein